MRAAITLLVLLFSMCGAQTRSTQTVQTESQNTGAAAAAAEVSCSKPVDIYAELKELRDVVVEQRTILKCTQDELKKMEAENAAMKERLVASETRVEAGNAAQQVELANVKADNAAQQADLEEVKTRLAASEAEVVNLKMETAAPTADLKSVAERLAAAETEVEHLETIAENSKVAFSAGLTDSGYLEAGNTDLNLVFTKIITNVGQAYDSSTGFFTAPVRGVYYFRFRVMDYPSAIFAHVRISKNNKQVLLVADNESQGHIYLSGGVTLQLEVGDVVNMQLPAGKRLFDDTTNQSTFSGFMLFPL